MGSIESGSHLVSANEDLGGAAVESRAMAAPVSSKRAATAISLARPQSEKASGQDKEVKSGEADYDDQKATGHLPLTRLFDLVDRFPHSFASHRD